MRKHLIKGEKKDTKNRQVTPKIRPFFWKLVVAPQLWGRAAVVAGTGGSRKDSDCRLLRENWEIFDE